jgi:hypothetical protein
MRNTVMNPNRAQKNRRLALALIVFITFMFVLAFIWTRQYVGLGS